MVNGFEALSQDDVVSIYPEVFQQLNVSNTFKAVHLLESIKVYIGSKTIEASLSVNRENFRMPSDWKSGALRVHSLPACAKCFFMYSSFYQSLLIGVLLCASAPLRET
ncbi:hypothetical protein [Tolypothrix sp. VBCCA 56010]|uniref:hypothetical protein n=1 Tax=Tolypothrix sp. VBCCA 56010 TaxID=3137731 RepID=UPI003D7DBC88